MALKSLLPAIVFLLLNTTLFAQTVFIDNGATWRYYDAGNEPAAQTTNDWNDPAYDDAAWNVGAAELGYGDLDEATTVASVYTAYFRHTFNVADPDIFGGLDLELTYDDAAVVYLNGVEVWAVNMPAAPYTYNTFAVVTSADNAFAANSIISNLVAGNNVLAVEVHQRSIISSDLSFDFKLTAIEVPSTSLIPIGSDWNYYDLGMAPPDQGGQNWTELTYDDASWSTGPAHLGYGEGDEDTVIGDSVFTAYFRHTFNVPDPTVFSSLVLSLVYDDGAAVYVNGVEVWAVNMPAPPYSYGDFTPASSADNSTAMLNLENILLQGDNIIAVELHQRGAASSDLSFDFELISKYFPPATFVNYGDTWAYYDLGAAPADQGLLDWNDIGYDTSGWSAGPAHLGFGDGDEATTITSGVHACYFRKIFNVPNTSIFTDIDLNLIRDDGAVVYLNGTEVMSDNMPDPPYSYGMFSSGVGVENGLVTQKLNNLLTDGENVIAVEVHNTSAISSDLSFDFKLVANTVIIVEVERGPYLQKASPSTMTIKWRTSHDVTSIIDYGPAPDSLNQTLSDSLLKSEHELEITGLDPSTVYYYQIRSEEDVLVPPANDSRFKTSPPEGTQEPITAWILGDCGTANNNQRAVRDAYYNYIGANHTDMMLFLGDNAYNSGTDQEYQYAIFENMYEEKLKNTVSWSCLGNHDGFSADSDSQTGPYYDIFSFPKNGECGGVASGTEAYYSFDYGNIHFIILESYETDRSVGGPMYNWCEVDIQNTLSDWIVAIWHHPAYTKGSHNSDTETNLIQMRQNFLPLLESNGVDLVLSGHSHSYERSYFLNGHYGNANTFDAVTQTVGATGSGNGKLDVDGHYAKASTGTEAGKGAVYITTGSAGKTSPGTLNHNAMYYSVSSLGSCILEVEQDTMNVKFLRNTGAVDDYFTITKGCLSTLVLHQSIPDKTFHAADEVISDGLVPENGNVLFKAGVEINLEPDFEVAPGAIFEALIEDCGEQ